MLFANGPTIGSSYSSPEKALYRRTTQITKETIVINWLIIKARLFIGKKPIIKFKSITIIPNKVDCIAWKRI